MWSRICTTCPEKPHCGNCGVPFINSTTSFDFTSFSMNCSMLIVVSFWAQPLVPWFYGPASARKTQLLYAGRHQPLQPKLPIYVPPNHWVSKSEEHTSELQS